MLSGSEKEMFQFYKENLAAEVSIEYRKKAGESGKVTLLVSGPGAMLFDGICVILKQTALAEAKRMGDSKASMEYVNLVRDMVIMEIEEVS